MVPSTFVCISWLHLSPLPLDPSHHCFLPRLFHWLADWRLFLCPHLLQHLIFRASKGVILKIMWGHPLPQSPPAAFDLSHSQIQSLSNDLGLPTSPQGSQITLLLTSRPSVPLLWSSSVSERLPPLVLCVCSFHWLERLSLEISLAHTLTFCLHVSWFEGSSFEDPFLQWPKPLNCSLCLPTLITTLLYYAWICLLVSFPLYPIGCKHHTDRKFV